MSSDVDLLAEYRALKEEEGSLRARCVDFIEGAMSDVCAVLDGSGDDDCRDRVVACARWRKVRDRLREMEGRLMCRAVAVVEEWSIRVERHGGDVVAALMEDFDEHIKRAGESGV